MKHLIEGIELIGKTKDAGYKDAYYLIRTPQKQYIQLSELLFQTVAAMQKEKTLEAVAERVSMLQDKEVDVHAIRFLIDNKLEHLGIINDKSVVFEFKKKSKQPPAPDMLHALKYRITLLPEKAVSMIANLYLPFFNVWVMGTLIFAGILLNVWLFVFHGIAEGLQQTLYAPALFLLVFGLVILSSLFHEIGHATGAMYGGSKPGRIGAGLYLIWPAFFTDITDVYRLGRTARLRSDLGGVYFNVLFSLLIGIVYFITGFEPILLLILMQNLAIVHQLMPFLRLDGYFIVSDIVGVPDLFMRIGPILKNVFLGKKTNATHDLKLWVKWIITLWVVITIPLLVFIIGSMMLHAPEIVGQAVNSIQIHTESLTASLQQKDYLAALAGVLQLIILLLPSLGIGMMIYILGKPVVMKINAKLDSYITPGPLVSKRFP